MKKEGHNNAASFAEAERFLKTLDGTTNEFLFQVFDDLKSRRDRRLAAAVRGALEDRFEYLCCMNQQGAGVFVAVNAIKAGCARRIENLERVRAVFQDDDRGWNGSFPIFPSMTVLSSPGRYQRYWLVDGMEPDLHQAVQRRLILDYGSDPGAHDLVRVLRLPGFHHMKDPENPHLVKLLDAPGWIYSSDQLAAAFPPIVPEPCEAKPFNPRRFEWSDQGLDCLLEALSYIPADDRRIWLYAGMALHSELGEDGRPIWDGWSQTSPKFNAKDQARTWRSFKRGSGRVVTLGTLYHLARSYGFRFHGGRHVL